MTVARMRSRAMILRDLALAYPKNETCVACNCGSAVKLQMLHDACAVVNAEAGVRTISSRAGRDEGPPSIRWVACLVAKGRRLGLAQVVHPGSLPRRGFSEGLPDDRQQFGIVDRLL
jgi:hypothetical protein